jgi:ABC-type glycerol-3-phosphate transport system permease component
MSQQSQVQRPGFQLSKQAQDRIVGALTFLLLLAISLLVALPFLWMLSTSLKPDLRAIYQFPPEWIPREPAWGNYLRAWRAAPFGRYMLNSTIVAVGVMVLQVVNGCLAAYVFSRIRFPGREVLFLLFLAVLMIPTQVTVVPNYIILSRLGWLDTYWALIIPFAATAFGTFLIRQSFLSIPQDLVDAALIDGASHLTILRHIMIPLSKPMIITFALLSFNWRWNDYFWVLIMTNSDTMRTLPVGIVAMRGGAEGGSNWHIIMAATIIVLLPILLLFILAQRYFIEGIARTGLKG